VSRHNVLVIANETVAGHSLLHAIERRADADREVRVLVMCPINQPRHGYVVYEDTRRAAAGRRLDRTLKLLRDEGVHAHGLVVDADPLNALRDALSQHEVDEVIVSTHPRSKSGWLRRDVVDQMRRAVGGIPFEHVVVDLEAEREEKNVLVVANETVMGEPLLERIRARHRRGPAGFLIVSPQSEAEGSYDEAERRLRRTLGLLRGEGLDVHGQIVHPDPYTAVMHVLHDERVDEIVISTYPAQKSGWLRRHLVERLRADAGVPVDHVVVEPSAVEASA
jgi:hypothetical protein